MRCGYGISSRNTWSAELFAWRTATILKQMTFLGTLAGFGFLLGVISGTIAGALT
jgi:hypothetical protein